MPKNRTGWEEHTEVITARFNTLDPRQRKAVEIIREYQGFGRSVQSILTTALLASEELQFQEPTLGDVAAKQIMVSVHELGELLHELKQYRLAAPGQVEERFESRDDDDDPDYANDVLAYLQKRRGS
jgi:hypothetical protein